MGNDFPRVRVGVGRPPEGWDTADFVLSKWGDAERVEVESAVPRAADAVESFLRDGVEDAMNRFNAHLAGGSSQAEPTDGVDVDPEER